MRAARQAIERELRQRIRDGRYPPKSRIPSHRQLQAELHVSSETLQRAFDRLVEQGYVERCGARGSFVTAQPPRLHRIALVFPEEPDPAGWNRFWSTILAVGEQWRDTPIRFQSYFLAGRDQDSQPHRRLCADLADGSVTGVIFASPPFFIDPASPVFAPGIPRVFIGSEGMAEARRYHASSLRLDSTGLNATLIERFRSVGCRRFAAFVAIGSVESVRHECYPLLQAAGMETRIEWWHGLPMDPFGAPSARRVVHLLCSLPSRQRPDCLLIGDDNLVAHVTAGLLDAGIDVPTQIRVAAHANFPCPTHASVPLLRYGPDIEALLRCAAAEIDRLATTPGDFALLQVPVEIRGRGAEPGAR